MGAYGVTHLSKRLNEKPAGEFGSSAFLISPLARRLGLG